MSIAHKLYVETTCGKKLPIEQILSPIFNIGTFFMIQINNCKQKHWVKPTFKHFLCYRLRVRAQRTSLFWLSYWDCFMISSMKKVLIFEIGEQICSTTQWFSKALPLIRAIFWLMSVFLAWRTSNLSHAQVSERCEKWISSKNWH